MPENPTVTVVIPAWNAEDFLNETISSVLDQTQQDVETIIVDDGSTDGTSKVASRFASRMLLIRQPNQGVSAARNRGLAEARGRYVCFLDADDWLYPECLERKVALLDSEIELGIAISWIQVTGPDLQPTGTVLKGSEGYILRDLLNYIPPPIPCPSNALIRKEILNDMGGFDEDLGTGADFDMWLRIARQHRVGRVKAALVKYRRHESAMFHNVEAQVHDMEKILKKHRGDLGKLKEWKVLKWRFYRSVAGEYLRRGQYWKVLRPLLKGGFSAGWLI